MQEIIIVLSVIVIVFLLWLFRPSKTKFKREPDIIFAQNIYNIDLKGDYIQVMFENGDVIYIDPNNYPDQFKLVVKEFTCLECDGTGREEEFSCQKPGLSAGECCGGCYESRECYRCDGKGFHSDLIF